MMYEKEIYKKVGQFSIAKSGENSTAIDSKKAVGALDRCTKSSLMIKLLNF